MAQDKADKKHQEASDDRVEDSPQEESVSPLQAIIHEMRAAAEGGSVAPLRSTVDRVMPRDKAAARVLFNQLVRLRDSGDVAVTQATQVMAALDN